MKNKHVFIIFVILGIDQVTKAIIDSSMSLYQRIPIIPGFFNITYLQNTGAAWSMFEGKMSFFYLVTILALIAMFLFYYNSDKNDKWTRLALAMMIAGTLGNSIDRIVFHHVRDFLDFVIFGYDFPVFNVADMALCIGVFLIIVDVLTENYRMVHKR